MGGVVGGLAALFLILVAFLLLRRRNRRRPATVQQTQYVRPTMDTEDMIEHGHTAAPVIPYNLSNPSRPSADMSTSNFNGGADSSSQSGLMAPVATDRTPTTPSSSSDRATAGFSVTNPDGQGAADKNPTVGPSNEPSAQILQHQVSFLTTCTDFQQFKFVK